MREADRPARRLPRHPRPGRDARERRRPHGRAGLDAAPPPRRPGPARACSGREAFQEMDYEALFGSVAKWVGQADGGRPDPRARLARVRGDALGPARARPCWRCPRTCSSRRPTWRTRPRSTRRARSRRGRRPGAPARAPGRRRAAARRSSARAAGARRPARTCSPSARRAACPSPPRSAARTTSTTTRRVYAGHLTIGLDPALAAPRAGGRPARGRRRPAGRHHHARLHAPRRPAPAPDARPRPPGPRRARRASTSPTWRSSPGCPSSRRRRAPSSRSSRAGRRGRRPRGPTTWRTSSIGPLPGDLDLGEFMAVLRRRLPADAVLTSRRGELHRVGAPLLRVLRLPEPARAAERGDGLRHPCRARRQGARTRSGPSSASPGTATS